MGELYVKFEPISADVSDPLAKKVDEAYLGKPVMDLVKYMANPTPDTANSGGYNAEETRRAQLLSEGLNDSINNPGQYKFQVKAKTNTEPPEMKELSLDAVLSEYSDSIIRTDSIEKEGETVTYKVIEMIGEVIDVGGR